MIKKIDLYIKLKASFWFQGETEDFRFPRNIMWTDEATFNLNVH